MVIKVLGPGCGNCKRLEANAAAALAELGMASTIEKVTDYGEIASYGVASTPALVFDNKVLVSGRVPSVGEICSLLEGAAAG